MATSTVDGTIAEAVLKRARGGISIFDTIRFQLDDGSSRTIKKAVVMQDVADALQVGTSGRFYLYTAFDLKGVHAVRTRDGHAVHGFPANNKKVFLILGIVNIAWITLKLFTDAAVPLLGVGMLILATVGWVLMGKGQREAREQFDADSAYGGIAPAA